MIKVKIFMNVPIKLFLATLSVILFFLVIISFIIYSGIIIYELKDIDSESFKLIFSFRELQISNKDSLAYTESPDILKANLEISLIQYETALLEFGKFKKNPFFDKKIKQNIESLEYLWKPLKSQIIGLFEDLDKITDLILSEKIASNYNFIKKYYESIEKPTSKNN